MIESINNTNTVYNSYKTTIAGLIARIEVYEHDLPGEIMVQVAELFQSIVMYETTEDVPLKEKLNESLQYSCSSIIQSLYKHTIWLFLKKIKEHRKSFRQFKYKGIMMNDKSFYYIVKKQRKDIVKTLKKHLRKCYKGHMLTNIKGLSIKNRLLYLYGYMELLVMPIDLQKEPYIPTVDLASTNLLYVFDNTDKLLKMYQQVYPDVLKSGKKRSLKMSIFIIVVSWIIPITMCMHIIQKLIMSMCK